MRLVRAYLAPALAVRVAGALLGLGLLAGLPGCGGGADPNNLTPEQEKNIQDELQSQEELEDQPPI